MALNCFMGLMGAGKSYVAVNEFVIPFLRDTTRPIYTNLPCDGEELECLLARAHRNPARREEMRARLHFLPREPGEMGEVEENGANVDRDRLLEFWYFTEPNALIFLDEVGDLYNTEKRKERPDFLVSYINHHRHYKDDLYFFLQDIADLDPQVRRKVQHCHVVTNSTKVNMFEWWALRGLRWPIQFFRCRTLLGSKLRRGDPYVRSEQEPDEVRNFWPSSRGFKCYRSFSAASSLPGKRLPDGAAVSSDFDPKGGRRRILAWLGQSGLLWSLGVGLAVALWLGYKGLYAMAGLDSTAVGTALGRRAAGPAGQGTTNAVSGEVPAQPGVAVAAVGVAEKLPERERVILSVPGRFRTTKGTYAVGSLVGSNRVARVFADGVEFSDGTRRPFDSLF